MIPSLMAGSAVSGALSMAFGATSRAPHGGIWVVGLIGQPALYLLAIGAGVAVSTVSVVALKSVRGNVLEIEAPAPREAAAAVLSPGSVVAA